jgi:hypothetical protein
MATLAQLSEARLSAGLEPIIAEWAPGRDLPSRLLTGRDAALAALTKHVPNLKYSQSEATSAMRDIEAWAERNDAALSAIMASTTTELPETLQLEMGARRAQSFVMAIFTQAAVGLGAWASGAVADAARSPSSPVNDRWARADAAQRLELFALVVKLDRDGSLQRIFGGPGQGAGALGAVPLWFVAVVLVIFAAAVVTAVVLVRRLELNNKLLRDLCQDKLAAGDKEAFETCVEATKGLQTTSLERLPERIGYALVAGALVYGLARWAGPWLLSQRNQLARRTP